LVAVIGEIGLARRRTAIEAISVIASVTATLKMKPSSVLIPL
jgi:hypothetical protein